MKYYISDLHLFHRNVTAEGKNYDKRPFATMDEMLKYIHDAWNKKVTNGDTVYILGDTSMRNTDEALISYMAALRGQKHLITGNHDDIRDARYQRLFADITPYKETEDFLGKDRKRLVLSHFPILFWNNQHRNSIHLYGHVHNSVEEAFFQDCIRRINSGECPSYKEGDAPVKAYNVGCMMPYMGYVPRTLNEIVAGAEALRMVDDGTNR